jgi:hypothetical protein
MAPTMFLIGKYSEIKLIHKKSPPKWTLQERELLRILLLHMFEHYLADVFDLN